MIDPTEETLAAVEKALSSAEEDIRAARTEIALLRMERSGVQLSLWERSLAADRLP